MFPFSDFGSLGLVHSRAVFPFSEQLKHNMPAGPSTLTSCRKLIYPCVLLTLKKHLLVTWLSVPQFLPFRLFELVFELLCLSFFAILTLSSSKLVSAIVRICSDFDSLTIVCIPSEYKPCTRQMFLNLSDSVKVPSLSSCSQSWKSSKFWRVLTMVYNTQDYCFFGLFHPVF
jgi:hypothetical protein